MKTHPAGGQAMAAREAALQMLYALELGLQNAAQIERWYSEAHPLAPGVRERAAALVESSVRHQPRIEALIRSHARGWTLERISMIDRSLLKLAIAELLEAPATGESAAAVITAGQRLAGKFSQPGAMSFLRGLLEAVVRELSAAPEAASHVS